jgi:hypothetical protein
MEPCNRQLGIGMDREMRRSRVKNSMYLRRGPLQRRVMPFEKLVDESPEWVKVSMIKIRIQNGVVVRDKTTCNEIRQRVDERVLISPVILGKSQVVKNRNLSRLISNLNRLKKKYPVLVYTVIFLVYFVSPARFWPIMWLDHGKLDSNTLHFCRISTPPAYSAYPAFIRHCPFYYNILNDIKDHSTSSRNRNRGNSQG